MKKILAGILMAGLTAVFALPLAAQGNPRGTAKLDLKGKSVTVEYGRPSLKGRTAEQLLEKVPAGGVWRLGADKSTTFSTQADLMFGSTAVPKGDYSLFAQKDANGSWKLIFNKQTGQWGTQHDAAQDLASVPLTRGKADKAVEQVTISLAAEKSGGMISIEWGDLVLSTGFDSK